MFNYNLYCGLPDEDSSLKFDYNEQCITIGQLSMEIDTNLQLITRYAEVSFATIFGFIKTVFVFIMKFFSSFYGLLLAAIIAVIAFMMRDKTPKMTGGGGGGGGGGSTSSSTTVSTKEKDNNTESNVIEIRTNENAPENNGQSVDTSKVKKVGSVEVVDVPKVEPKIVEQPKVEKSKIETATPKEIKETGTTINSTITNHRISNKNIKRIWDEVYNNEHVGYWNAISTRIPSSKYEEIANNLEKTNGNIYDAVRFIIENVIGKSDVLKKNCTFLGNSVFFNIDSSDRMMKELAEQGIWEDSGMYTNQFQKDANALIKDVICDEIQSVANSMLSKTPIQYGICDMKYFRSFTAGELLNIATYASNLVQLSSGVVELTTSIDKKIDYSKYMEYLENINRYIENSYASVCDIPRTSASSVRYSNPEKIISDMTEVLNKISPTHFKELKSINKTGFVKSSLRGLEFTINSAIGIGTYDYMIELYATDYKDGKYKLMLEKAKSTIPKLKKDFDEAKDRIDNAAKNAQENIQEYIDTSLKAMKHAKVLVDIVNSGLNSLNVILRDAQNPVWKACGERIADCLSVYLACRILNPVYRMEKYDKK